MKEKNKLKWWHHLLLFLTVPTFLTAFFAFIVCIGKFIESLPESYRGPAGVIFLALFLGTCGYVSMIDEIKKRM